jgi:probable HAF family extracellular repeat protein
MSPLTRRLLISMAIVAAALGSIDAQAAPPPRYKLTLLPDVGLGVSAAGINNKGDVTGTVTLRDVEDDPERPSSTVFIYSDGKMTLATCPHLCQNDAVDINDRGQVVGTFYADYEDFALPFLFENGTFISLGSLGSYNLSYARSINNRGEVVGVSNTEAGERAFLYSGGRMVDLLPDALGASAESINDLGEITGSLFGNDRGRAFVYANGKVKQLADPRNAIRYLGSYGVKINNRGDVAGGLTVDSVTTHPFLYRRGVMRDLGTLGGVRNYVRDLNDSGQVVGFAWVAFAAGERLRPFIHTGGRMLDLNYLTAGRRGFELQTAVGINNAGQIVGNGAYWGDYKQRAFVLTPIASPTGAR